MSILLNSTFPVALSAFGLGVLHAFEPGHGKTLIAGALINTKRIWRDPVVLAASSAVGHLAGVLLFTTISYFAINNLLPAETAEYLPVFIGAIIFILGLYFLVREGKHHTAHAESGECECCGPQIAVQINRIRGVKGISLIGLLAGLVPCPSVLALASSTSMLPSISQALTVALIFGLGVAFAMLVLGLSVTHLSQRFNLSQSLERFSSLARHAAPVALIVVGAVIVVNGFLDHIH